MYIIFKYPVESPGETVIEPVDGLKPFSIMSFGLYPVTKNPTVWVIVTDDERVNTDKCIIRTYYTGQEIDTNDCMVGSVVQTTGLVIHAFYHFIYKNKEQ